mgnify:CR=1 FL=1
MLNYFLKRLLGLIPTLLIVAVLVLAAIALVKYIRSDSGK